MAKVVCLQKPQEDCDVEVSIASRLGHDGVVLYATSSLLSKIPFFETSLREPWKRSCKRKADCGEVRVLELECADRCSPQDYVACFRFLLLESESESHPPTGLIKSVPAAVNIMRCADHLLFKECVDVCMKYLAAAPWSEDKERAIQDAVSGMGFPLSPDLARRLHIDQSIDEFRIFKGFFTQLILDCPDTKSFKCNRVEAIVKQAVKVASCEVLNNFYKPLFLQIWLERKQKLLSKCQGHFRTPCPVLRDNWVSYTYVLLSYIGGKADFAKAIALDSSTITGFYFEYLGECKNCAHLASVLTEIFLGAISIEHGTITFLSNSERASLLVAWAAVVSEIEDAKLHKAFTNVCATLPPHHPSIVQLMMKNKKKPFFNPCYAWWRSRLSKRFKHVHFLLDHFDLCVGDVEFYTKLLASEQRE